MSRWGTILLLIFAGSVAAFLFYFEPSLRSQRGAEVRRDALVNVDVMQIKGLRMTSGSEVIELTRQPDGWLVGPNQTDHADGGRVAAILSGLMETKIIDTIPASEIRSPKDLRRYGLEDPRSKLEILGDDPVTINFGREAVGDDRVYAQIDGDGSVYVVSGPVQAAAFQNWQVFRDRRLTRYSAAEIDRFTIRRPNGEIDLQRSPTGWQLMRPMQVDGNDENITSLINAILGAQVVAFSENQEEPASLLDASTTEVIFYPDDRDVPLRLMIGAAESVNGTPVVRVDYPERNSAFLLFPEIVRLTNTAPDEIRDRRLLRLNLDAIDIIRVIALGKPEVQWKRNAGGWQAGDEPTIVPERFVSELVNGMINTNVQAYQLATPDAIAMAGLDPPAVEIYFDAWVSENTPEAVAGRHPIAALAVGAARDGTVGIRPAGGPEVCTVADAPVRRFLDWAEGRSSPGANDVP